MKTLLRTLLISLLIVSGGAIAGDDGEAKASLYERLGAMDGINSIVSDTIALHLENEAISHYFEGVDLDNLAHHVAAFFAAGTGGPANYEGRDMTSTHAHMNMSDADFDSAVADVLKAVKGNGVDDGSASEVAAILESLRPAVMGTVAN
jgi:hemoglobin